MAHQTQFETNRLLIRSVHTDDAAFILELMNTPKWLEYIGDRQINTLDQASHYIAEKAYPQLKKHGYTNNVIIRKEDGAKLGTCGLYHREGKSNPDIGFAFLPEFEGFGYAFEASKALMNLAKTDYGLKELNGYTLEHNFSSRKLLEKLGFNLIGVGFLPNNNDELLHYHCKFEIK